MTRNEILHLLRDAPLDELMARADAARRRFVGDEVHLRGIVEFSSHCCRDCLYCGLRRSNRAARRYRLSPQAVAASAVRASEAGMDTVVLQSGDDHGFSAQALAEAVRAVKAETALVVTLSVGERPFSDYELWREAGADRFLMKHETANSELYARLHPGKTLAERLACLRFLKRLGYEIGTGFIVGLPGQTLDDLADDVLLVRELEADMCGAGPFLPQADTPLAGKPKGSLETTLRLLAVLRLARPELRLPATTALATLDPDHGQRLALEAGADVIMPSFTPPELRSSYAIYDGKLRVGHQDARTLIAQCGRREAQRGGNPSCRTLPRGCGSTSASSVGATSANRPC